MLAKLCASLILVVLVGRGLPGRAEDGSHRGPSNGVVLARTPFHIFADCPPAACTTAWDGFSDPASGYTDFHAAGVPIVFQFETGEPYQYQCDQQHEQCTAMYNSGIFTATGPGGTFNGVITSGYATFNSDRYFETYVTFSGQWSNGQYMTGSGDEHYLDMNGYLDTTLIMYPSAGPGDTPAK